MSAGVCYGCSFVIRTPDDHPEECEIGQMQRRDARISLLERKVARLEGRLRQLLDEHGQAL
jgi:hypothetical protein